MRSLAYGSKPRRPEYGDFPVVVEFEFRPRRRRRFGRTPEPGTWGASCTNADLPDFWGGSPTLRGET